MFITAISHMITLSTRIITYLLSPPGSPGRVISILGNFECRGLGFGVYADGGRLALY